MLRTKLRQAFQVSYKNADKLLYVLLYAFLASVDVSGEFERVEKQLETGKELAKSMGGMDRVDGVGHGSLGVWFSRKLSSESPLLLCHLESSARGADGRDVQTIWTRGVYQNGRMRREARSQESGFDGLRRG
jgi:hypothetical protein